jgi:hypothetical protein
MDLRESNYHLREMIRFYNEKLEYWLRLGDKITDVEKGNLVKSMYDKHKSSIIQYRLILRKNMILLIYDKFR